MYIQPHALFGSSGALFSSKEMRKYCKYFISYLAGFESDFLCIKTQFFLFVKKKKTFILYSYTELSYSTSRLILVPPFALIHILL